MTPGYSTWILTSVSRRSTCRHSAHAEIAALVAEYADSPGGERRAATDDTYMSRPLRATISSSSANVRRTGEK